MRNVTRDGVNWTVSEPSKSEFSFWTEFMTIEWEQWTLDMVDRFVTEGSTMVDIGAWTGPVSMWAADRHNARVIAIEPDPVALDYLHLHAAVNKFDKIEIVDGALANHTGITHIQPHEFGWGSTMTHLAPEGREVDCWSIEDIFSKYNIENCSLAKMDIEGGESIILETVGPFLASKGIPLVLAIHQPWWPQPLNPAWLDGYSEIQGDLVGWNSVLCLP